MRLRLKMLLLLCLMLSAVLSAVGAWRSLQVEKGRGAPRELYEKLIEDGGEAEYYLRSSGNYVAVFEGEREKTPLSVTGIELSVLRSADRAMLELGIPARSLNELLMLLEDLGS